MFNPAESKFLRTYATALATTLFLIVGGSGALIFFHLGGGSLKGVHEWLGLGFLAAGLLHVLRNAKPFLFLLKAPRTQVILGASLMAVAVFLTFAPAGNGGGSPSRQLMTLAEKAPLSRLAPVLGLDGEDLVARLAEDGITASVDQTVNEIASSQHIAPPKLLSKLMNEEPVK